MPKTDCELVGYWRLGPYDGSEFGGTTVIADYGPGSIDWSVYNKAMAKFTPAEPERTIADEIDELAQHIHGGNIDRGFYDDVQSDNAHDCLAKLALCVSEVAEAMQLICRADIPESDKIIGYTSEEEEIADAVIRLLDFAGWRGLRVGSAMAAKLGYNETRGYKHGKRA